MTTRLLDQQIRFHNFAVWSTVAGIAILTMLVALSMVYQSDTSRAAPACGTGWVAVSPVTGTGTGGRTLCARSWHLRHPE